MRPWEREEASPLPPDSPQWKAKASLSSLVVRAPPKEDEEEDAGNGENPESPVRSRRGSRPRRFPDSSARFNYGCSCKHLSMATCSNGVNASSTGRDISLGSPSPFHRQRTAHHPHYTVHDHLEGPRYNRQRHRDLRNGARTRDRSPLYGRGNILRDISPPYGHGVVGRGSRDISPAYGRGRGGIGFRDISPPYGRGMGCRDAFLPYHRERGGMVFRDTSPPYGHGQVGFVRRDISPPYGSARSFRNISPSFGRGRSFRNFSPPYFKHGRSGGKFRDRSPAEGRGVGQYQEPTYSLGNGRGRYRDLSPTYIHEIDRTFQNVSPIYERGRGGRKFFDTSLPYERAKSPRRYNDPSLHISQGNGGRYQDRLPQYGHEREERITREDKRDLLPDPLSFRDEPGTRNNPNIAPRAGDWICSNSLCGNLNFARREYCNSCNKFRYEPEDVKLNGGHSLGQSLDAPVPPLDLGPRRDAAGFGSPRRGWPRDEPRDTPPRRGGRLIHSPVQTGRADYNGEIVKERRRAEPDLGRETREPWSLGKRVRSRSPRAEMPKDYRRNSHMGRGKDDLPVPGREEMLRHA